MANAQWMMRASFFTAHSPLCMGKELYTRKTNFDGKERGAMIELPVIPSEQQRRKRPDWLRVKLPIGPEYAKVRKLVDEHKLHTICESGNCPNMGEC